MCCYKLFGKVHKVGKMLRMVMMVRKWDDDVVPEEISTEPLI